MPRYLPGELIDLIISLVPDRTDGSDHSDYQALLSCALVCQAWLPASRAALLDCIRLNRRAAYNSFVEHVLHSERLLPYLQSIRVLWIHQGVGEPGSRVEGQPWSNLFIRDHMDHFPNLEELRLWGIVWRPQSTFLTSFDVAVSCLTSLRKLELRSCKLPSWHNLRRILTALSSSLTVLALWEVTWPDSYADTPGVLQPAATALVEFALNSSSGDDAYLVPILRWLSGTRTGNSLRSLILTSLNLTTEHMAFVTTVAPGLTRLYIDISLISQSNFPFHELRSLRTLEVGLLWSLGSYWIDISRLLPTIPPRLCSVEFYVRPMEAPESDLPWSSSTEDLPELPQTKELPELCPIEDEGLELLDIAIQADTFEDLERIEFVLYVPSTTTVHVNMQARVLETLHRKLPSALSRGILTLRSVVDQSEN